MSAGSTLWSVLTVLQCIHDTEFLFCLISVLLLSKTKIGDITVMASDFLVQGNR